MNAAAGIGGDNHLVEMLVGVAGAAGEMDRLVDVEGDGVCEAEESDLGGRFERSTTGCDGRGSDEFQGWVRGSYGVREGEWGVLFDAKISGGEVRFGEALMKGEERIFVLLPKEGEGGFALREGEEDFSEAVAFEEGADDERRSGSGDDVGEEALGLSPVGSGEILQGGSGGDEDAADFVLFHELASAVEAGFALLDGDGDDVFLTIVEREHGGG